MMDGETAAVEQLCMSSWLEAKIASRCPRCGGPSSETSVLCDEHRRDAAARTRKYAARVRPARRKVKRCAFCRARSRTYRCTRCQQIRQDYDAGRHPSAGGAGLELGAAGLALVAGGPPTRFPAVRGRPSSDTGGALTGAPVARRG
jgi:hypothetical protein